jgi:hypothetical protein
MKERGLLAPRSWPRAFVLGVYVIYDNGRPVAEAYDRPQGDYCARAEAEAQREAEPRVDAAGGTAASRPAKRDSRRA